VLSVEAAANSEPYDRSIFKILRGFASIILEAGGETYSLHKLNLVGQLGLIEDLERQLKRGFALLCESENAPRWDTGDFVGIETKKSYIRSLWSQ
jgi:hypothetical protein